MVTIILHILFLLSYTLNVFSQPVILTENDLIGNLRISTIDKTKGIIENVLISNLKVDLTNIVLPRDYRIDDWGEHLIAKRKWIAIQDLQANDLPKIIMDNGDFIDSAAKFTSDKNTIILYRNQDILLNTEYHSSLTCNYYNLQESKVLNQFTIINKYLTEYQISHDGTTILGHENTNIFNLYTIQDNSYTQKVLGPYITSIYPMMSRSGNRLFFLMQNTPEVDMHWVYVEKQADEWSQEISVPMAPLNVDGVDVVFDVVAVVNDGKTLILQSNYDSSLEAQMHYLAVVHEEENGWSKPEFVGQIDYLTLFKLSSSEDGRVIAMQQENQYSEPVWNILKYDAYVFIKNAEGKWIKNKVNPEGTQVMQDILLSGDGSKLIWNPSVSSSVPSSSDLR